MAVHRAEVKILPSMIFGCGGRGTMAVHHCREIVLKDIFKGDEPGLNNFKPIRFYSVDSTQQPLQDTGEAHNMETIEVACPQIHEIIDNPQYPATGDSIKAVGALFPQDRDYAGELRTLRDSSQGMGTCPPIGRMNFLGSWSRIYKELRDQVSINWKNPFPAFKFDTVGINVLNQVFIVSGLYGGTGSGSHIDLAAMLRAVFKDLEIPQPVIYGIFLLPDIVGSRVDILRANTYACLKEIDHFMSGNPYNVTFANGKTLTISNNEENDYLFNKVFLINDTNKYLGTAGFQITETEVTKMIGELIFHWSCTSLGESINQRIIDEPRRYTQRMAPEKNSGAREKRITGYSTFGLASAVIPYAQLKKNLIVDFAIEVMSDLLLVPDDKSMEEEKKVETRKLTLSENFLRPQIIFGKLKLNHDDLETFFKMKPLLFTEVDMREYMEENELDSIEDVHSKIKKEVSSMRQNDADSSFSLEDEFIAFFKKELIKLKDEMLNKGGPQLAKTGLKRVKERIFVLLNEIEYLSTQEDLQRITDLLKRGSNQIEKSNTRSFFRKFGGKDKEIDGYKKSIYDPLKKTIKKYKKAQVGFVFETVLSRCIRILDEEVLSELITESEMFDKILTKLRNSRLPYFSDKLHFSPIPEDLLDNFINEFPYPAGSKPEDVGETIRKEGINIAISEDKTNRIDIHQFDDYPDDAVKAIMKKAEEVIGALGLSYWEKPFSESGFFPLGAVPAGSSWHLHAYSNTMDELIKRSSPYLEYQDGEGFDDTSKATFSIYPSTTKEEIRKWNNHTVQGKKFSFTGDTEKSSYQLTMLQFHFGLPLYCIDEIEDWMLDYKDIFDYGKRPVHKFKYNLKEPFINIKKTKTYFKNDINELYMWAKEVSEEGVYPILKLIPGDNKYVICSDDDVIEEFYYNLYEDVYLGIDKIEYLYSEVEQGLKKELKIILQNVINQSGSDLPLSDIFRQFIIANDIEKDNLISDVLNEFVKEKFNPESSIKINDTGEIHVFADSCPAIYQFVKNNFYRRKESRNLKTETVTDEDVVNKLFNNQDFFAAFLSVCEAAGSHMKDIGGEIIHPPKPFKELVPY